MNVFFEKDRLTGPGRAGMSALTAGLPHQAPFIPDFSREQPEDTSFSTFMEISGGIAGLCCVFRVFYGAVAGGAARKDCTPLRLLLGCRL